MPNGNSYEQDIQDALTPPGVEEGEGIEDVEEEKDEYSEEELEIPEKEFEDEELSNKDE